MLFQSVFNSGSDSDEDDIPVEGPQTTITVIRLKAKHDGGDGSPPKSWWRTRKERIFRKKNVVHALSNPEMATQILGPGFRGRFSGRNYCWSHCDPTRISLRYRGRTPPSGITKYLCYRRYSYIALQCCYYLSSILYPNFIRHALIVVVERWFQDHTFVRERLF